MEFLVWGVEVGSQRVIYLALASEPVPRRVAVAQEFVEDNRYMKFVASGGLVTNGKTGDQAFEDVLQKLQLVEISEARMETVGLADLLERLTKRFTKKPEQRSEPDGQPSAPGEAQSQPKTTRTVVRRPRSGSTSYPFSLD